MLKEVDLDIFQICSRYVPQNKEECDELNGDICRWMKGFCEKDEILASSVFRWDEVDDDGYFWIHFNVSIENKPEQILAMACTGTFLDEHGDEYETIFVKAQPSGAWELIGNFVENPCKLKDHFECT